MFGIEPSELMLVALVAIVFIGPKDLPRAMRFVGQWVGKGRTMARHFRTAIDDMVREAELAEMEQKWKAENERIMREHADLLATVSAPAAAAPSEVPSAAAVEAHPTPAPAVAAPETVGETSVEEPMLPLEPVAPARPASGH